MLVKALCDYYDILSEQGKMLSDGYSKIGVHFLVYLTPEGKIDEILDWQERDFIEDKKGKKKEILKSREIVLPKRTEKTGISSNYIEHRPLYLFGLNYENGLFTHVDQTDKAKKSHEVFKEVNLKFIDGIDTPVVNAYRNFIQNWIPEHEVDNLKLIQLGKSYKNSSFAFALSGQIELLHEDKLVKERWTNTYGQMNEEENIPLIAPCAITGDRGPVARIHSKIKGVYGGLATGTVLISFKNPSENSYGNSQSYNSNISVKAMKKYTEALNYIISSKKQTMLLDDMTVLYWAMSKDENCNDIMSALLFHNTDEIGSEEMEGMIQSLMSDAREGNIFLERLSMTNINPDIRFYMLGLKPNSSRLAIKFFYQKNFGELLQNIARHQNDMQILDQIHPVSLWQIKKEITSPKSKETVNPALMAKIFEAIVYGTNYPQFLLNTIVRRVKTDAEQEVGRVQAGIIKACINRKLRILNEKEELKLALDKENRNPAYLCGRLFAILEKLQQDASGNSLNRTIKDAYFASAASKPAVIFPKLLKLAQNHLRKSPNDVFFNKMIEEVINEVAGEFPDTLPLVEQGKFIIGYYQQYQSFFIKGDSKLENNTEEN